MVLCLTSKSPDMLIPAFSAKYDSSPEESSKPNVNALALLADEHVFVYLEYTTKGRVSLHMGKVWV